MTARALFAVDAGGSRTRAVVRPGTGDPRTLEFGSINDSTGPAATEALRDLLVEVRDLLDGGPATGWLASASVDPGRASVELDRLRAATTAAGLSVVLVVSNDLVPLLWGVPGMTGEGVVAVCGTGSGFFGADRAGRTVRVGGCEYLGSDEGGAVDIGLRGLRAAVRAVDGRGPETGLVAAFTAVSGVGPGHLARTLAAEPFPKQGLARLAPVVTATWLAGDVVATEVLRAMVDELLLGVRAVRDRLGLPEGFTVAATGGVLTGCRELYADLAERVLAELGAGHVELVTDTAGAVLTALTALLDADDHPSLPPGIAGEHAWLLAGATRP